jgi:hypothetical protein
MEHKERVQLFANYSQILSLPVAILSLVLAFAGPITKQSVPGSPGSPSPTPLLTFQNEDNTEPYRGLQRFWGNDAISNFFQNLTELVGRWAEENPSTAVASVACFLIAIALWIFGASAKARKARKPPG